MDWETVAGGLFERQKLSFIGSVDGAGYPQIRAMLRPRLREGVRVIYYSTNTPTDKVRHFLRDGRACVYVCDADAFEGLLLTGRMEVLEDAAHRALLWREGDELYYPGGVTDPDYCVLRFTAQRARRYAGMRTEEWELG